MERGVYAAKMPSFQSNIEYCMDLLTTHEDDRLARRNNP